MPSAPIRRVSTVDALVDALRSRILSGQLGPGTQMREVELAAELHVGRHSLRAALQSLVFEGLLRHEPNRGVFVPEMSGGDVEDLFLLRIAVETEAARLLVSRRTTLDGMADALLELEDLEGTEPWDQVVEIDLRFHSALIDAVGSVRMSRTFASLQAELRLLLAQLKPHYERPEAIGAEHRQVYDAIASGRGQSAVKAVREHLEVGVQDIRRTAPLPDDPHAFASARRAPKRLRGAR